MWWPFEWQDPRMAANRDEWRVFGSQWDGHGNFRSRRSVVYANCLWNDRNRQDLNPCLMRSRSEHFSVRCRSMFTNQNRIRRNSSGKLINNSKFISKTCKKGRKFVKLVGGLSLLFVVVLWRWSSVGDWNISIWIWWGDRFDWGLDSQQTIRWKGRCDVVWVHSTYRKVSLWKLCQNIQFQENSLGKLYRLENCLETNPCSSCFSSCLPSTTTNLSTIFTLISSGRNCCTSRITSNFSLSTFKVEPESCFWMLLRFHGRIYPWRNIDGLEVQADENKSSRFRPVPKCWSNKREVRIGRSNSSHQSRYINGILDIFSNSSKLTFDFWIFLYKTRRETAQDSRNSHFLYIGWFTRCFLLMFINFLKIF